MKTVKNEKLNNIQNKENIFKNNNFHFKKPILIKTKAVFKEINEINHKDLKKTKTNNFIKNVNFKAINTKDHKISEKIDEKFNKPKINWKVLNKFNILNKFNELVCFIKNSIKKIDSFIKFSIQKSTEIIEGKSKAKIRLILLKENFLLFQKKKEKNQESISIYKNKIDFLQNEIKNLNNKLEIIKTKNNETTKNISLIDNNINLNQQINKENSTKLSLLLENNKTLIIFLNNLFKEKECILNQNKLITNDLNKESKENIELEKNILKKINNNYGSIENYLKIKEDCVFGDNHSKSKKNID